MFSATQAATGKIEPFASKGSTGWSWWRLSAGGLSLFECPNKKTVWLSNLTEAKDCAEPLTDESSAQIAKSSLK